MLALWHARQQGVAVATLLTMFDETGRRSRSHGVPRELMARQAEALGLALAGPSASWAEYERVFVRALQELHGTGHRVAIFGDIDLAPHREWEERVCQRAGLRAHLPLWGRHRREVAGEALALGFRAVVVCTDSRYLPDDFCGREFDARLLEDLPAGVDPCGENGEFHTFVYDGPLFLRPVVVRRAGTEVYVAPPELGGVRYCFATLTPG